MKAVALLIAALLLLLGLTGILWPEGLMELVKYSSKAPGFYLLAFARAIIGGFLAAAAVATRTPKTVRVIGILIFIGGILVVVAGQQRAQQMTDWWIAKGPDALRIAACLPLAVGCFIGGSALTKNPRF